MHKKSLILLLAALLPTTALANNIKAGQQLPAITIQDQGQLILNNKNISYNSWSSEKLAGKTHVILAMAGRSSAKAMNAAMIEAISAANFPENKYQTTTIINQDDAIWGTSSFVKSAAEDSKREFPWSAIILDSKGVAQKQWDLKEESSAVIVLNNKGKVLFVKEGKLSQTEIKQAIALVKESI